MPQLKSFVGPARAIELLEGGEWIRQEMVLGEAMQHCLTFMRERPLERADRSDMSAYQSFLTRIRREEWPFESLEVIDPDRLGHVMAMRIGIGRIVKIKATAKSAIASALGIIYYSATVQAHGGLLLLGYLAIGWPVVSVLGKAFETISDPDELKVFEAVAALAAEICVVDAEAFSQENFRDAYGRRAPFREDILSRLDGKVAAHTVDKSLAALSQRGVLVCSDHRWQIAF